MSSLNYRYLIQTDLHACTRLFVDTFSQPPWLDQWQNDAHAGRYLHNFVDAPGFLGFVAEENSLVVAVCLGNIRHWWQGDEFFIQEFFVATSHQGQGIGQALMRFVKEELGERAIRNICLLTARGSRAEAFYQQCGISEISAMLFMAGPVGTPPPVPKHAPV